MDKLQLVKVLLRKGWTPQADVPRQLVRGAHVFLTDVAKRPKMYYLCLARSDAIFERQADLEHIDQYATESYYKCIMYMKNLSSIIAMDVPNTSDSTFKDTFKGMQPYELVDDMDDDGEPELELEEPAPPAALPAVAPLPALMPDLHLPPVVYVEDGVEYKAVFDNFTHPSGHRRAYIYCHYHDGRCRRYRFLRNFDNENHI
eukprot:6542290-Pyramimonas_sp.AAC.1